MTGNLTIVDKKTQSGTFRYEERIKSSEFREDIDYTFDEVKGIYTIISPKLRKEVLIIQNPYNENIDASSIEIKVLVDHKDEINLKPQIVVDLEKREGLIEASRGRNNFPQSLPPSRTSRLIEEKEVGSSRIWEIDNEEVKSEDTEMVEVEKNVDKNNVSGNVNKYTSPFFIVGSLAPFLILFGV